MRSINSVKNATVAMVSNIIAIIVGIITQALFLKLLGDEYAGINGLFTQIMSMLAIVELGFGNAIIYNLYKPVFDDDHEKIKSLMKFYKRTYKIIALCILFLGLILLPFIPAIVGEVNISESLYFIFLLYIIDVVISYLLTYKRSILYANQKVYITNLVHIGYLIVMNTIQVCMLIVYQNFILYLIIKIIFRFLENLIITVVANKMYPYITESNVKELDTSVKDDIVLKVKGLFFHKVSAFIVSGTDNILITMLLGIRMVATYTNYRLIVNALNELLNQIFNSLTASVGNLLVEDNNKNTRIVFDRLYLLNSWIIMLITACIFCIASPFVELIYGSKYVIPISILSILCINFYIFGMRRVYAVFKEAAGIFNEDRFVPILEAIINILASVIAASIMKKYGLVYGLGGIFIGTIISSMLLYLYSYPKYVYIGILKRNTLDYFKQLLSYSLTALATIYITYFITTKFIVGNPLGQIFVNLIICLIIPNVIYLILYGYKEEFKFYLWMMKGIGKKKNE